MDVKIYGFNKPNVDTVSAILPYLVLFVGSINKMIVNDIILTINHIYVEGRKVNIVLTKLSFVNKYVIYNPYRVTVLDDLQGYAVIRVFVHC